ncbi:MAG: N-acetylmuramic acid 6-phosphate etherase [Phycisphaeraceae bacterium]|nr:N-acetylmuramic acid 6-phosphate etherase [Phycisphaeraceae bacterium]
MTDSTPPDRSTLETEKRNPRSMALHAMNVRELVKLHRLEDAQVIAAMEAAEAALVNLIEAAEPGFVAGGRIVYLGAGTSGRLGVLDASEAPPTFQVDPGRVVGIIAGGDRALRRSSEGLEDDPDGAKPELETLNLTSADTVVGIASGGTTPYVLGGLQWARRTCPKAVVGLITATPMDRPEGIDHLVVLNTGPEILTGSTRMKAGTATKLALNTLSTTLMVRAGRVYENLMVDLRATNNKLLDRAARIVTMLCGVGRPEAFELLKEAGGAAKTAVVMQKLGLGRAEAEKKLRDCGGRLHEILT